MIYSIYNENTKEYVYSSGIKIPLEYLNEIHVKSFYQKIDNEAEMEHLANLCDEKINNEATVI
jgi:hypothetical protein